MTPPIAKKPKTDLSSQDSEIDLEALKKEWTKTGREERMTQGDSKIEPTFIAAPAGEPTMIPAREGYLCGGDWVLNSEGGAATISFIFHFKGRAYGLSVGHLVSSIGDPVFCFSDTTKIRNLSLPRNPEDNQSSESHFIHEIGTVVSLSHKTDSMVFELNGRVATGPPLMLHPKSGVAGALKLPDVGLDMPPPPLLEGTPLVGFGAQRRGAHGLVEVPSAALDCDYSKKGNIGMKHPDNVRSKVTDVGDCGTIFVSLDGVARYFHHCGDDPEFVSPPFLSYGYPIWDIMKSHAHLGGQSEEILEEGEEEKTLLQENSNVAGQGPKKMLKQFRTKIVDIPPRRVKRSLANFMDPNLKIVCGVNNTPVKLIRQEKSG